MSASPSGFLSGPPSGPPSNGRTPTPNGGAPKLIRRSKPGDPLRQRKPPRPVRPPPASKTSGPSTNGLRPVAGPARAAIQPRSSGQGNVSNGAGAAAAAPQGFSKIPDARFQDYPLITTKRALREGLRYHIARFQSKKDIDPSNQDEFTRPVSLHRRDPKQPPPGKALKDEELSAGLAMDDKEREKLEIARLEKEAQKAANLAQIAPSANNSSAAANKKNTAFRNEKTTQVFHLDETEEQRQRSDLRYEEHLPWHIEDADNKQTWVGNYEAALSHVSVLFVVDGNNFRMVPLEKWYKFTQKNQFKTLTIEEAEEKMKAKFKPARWAMHAEEQQAADIKKQETRRFLGGKFQVAGESKTYKQSGKVETQEADDLDIEDDLFQDDDEQMTVEPDNDEDAKNAMERIKREQMGANLFGEGDENEVEKEAKEEEKEEEAKRLLGRSVKKALLKRERNYLYDSNDDYSDSSDDETDEDEKKKEQERRKEEEAKLKAKSFSKVPSGASSKGTNTPSGRPSKHPELNKKNALKRAASPNLSASETSGNESSRKKPKKKHESSHPTGTSTPHSPSRGISPQIASQSAGSGPSPRKSSIITLNVNPSRLSDIQSAPPNPSPMSDGETEMSEGGSRKKKSGFKIRLGGGQGGSKHGSRAGSPVNGSRAGSPSAQNSTRQTLAPPKSTAADSQQQRAPTPTGPVQVEEIIAALPEEGIPIGALLKLFSMRLNDAADRKRFIDLVRSNTRYDKETKLIWAKS